MTIANHNIQAWYDDLSEYWKIRFAEKSGQLMSDGQKDYDELAHAIIKDEMDKLSK